MIRKMRHDQSRSIRKSTHQVSLLLFLYSSYMKQDDGVENSSWRRPKHDLSHCSLEMYDIEFGFKFEINFVYAISPMTYIYIYIKIKITTTPHMVESISIIPLFKDIKQLGELTISCVWSMPILRDKQFHPI